LGFLTGLTKYKTDSEVYKMYHNFASEVPFRIQRNFKNPKALKWYACYGFRFIRYTCNVPVILVVENYNTEHLLQNT